MEEALKFYEWLLKMKNIHLADHNRMSSELLVAQYLDNSIMYKP